MLELLLSNALYVKDQEACSLCRKEWGNRTTSIKRLDYKVASTFDPGFTILIVLLASLFEFFCLIEDSTSGSLSRQTFAAWLEYRTVSGITLQDCWEVDLENQILCNYNFHHSTHSSAGSY